LVLLSLPTTRHYQSHIHSEWGGRVEGSNKIEGNIDTVFYYYDYLKQKCIQQPSSWRGRLRRPFLLHLVYSRKLSHDLWLPFVLLLSIVSILRGEGRGKDYLEFFMSVYAVSAKIRGTFHTISLRKTSFLTAFAIFFRKLSYYMRFCYLAGSKTLPITESI